MVFKRSVPKRKYKRYEAYRSLLRKDFQCRCAYCTRQEGHNGGEANFCIDHYRPKDGPAGRPDLIAEYTNLFWCCRECNDNKADTWPTDEEQALGLRFIDPCNTLDDHDLHWMVNEDGSLESLTNAGEYTIEEIMLWRPELQEWRRAMLALQTEANDIEKQLLAQLTEYEQTNLAKRLAEVRKQIEPPVFDRPRLQNRRLADITLPTDPFA